MNTDNLTDREIAQYLKDCVEDDDFHHFHTAAMAVVRDPDLKLVQLLDRVESWMVEDEDVTREEYDRLHKFRGDLSDLMDAEIEDLKEKLREVRD